MGFLTISEVAKQIGVKASAIRYYEEIGILPKAQRISGQRRYDNAVLYRLALIQRSQQMGFSLDEVKQLFFGFRANMPISERWKKLSQKKLAELDTLAEQIKTMQDLLKKMSDHCTCSALEQCGKGIFNGMCGDIQKPRSAQETCGQKKK